MNKTKSKLPKIPITEIMIILEDKFNLPHVIPPTILENLQPKIEMFRIFLADLLLYRLTGNQGLSYSLGKLVAQLFIIHGKSEDDLIKQLNSMGMASLEKQEYRNAYRDLERGLAT